jgi:anti-anti-sigma factor
MDPRPTQLVLSGDAATVVMDGEFDIASAARARELISQAVDAGVATLEMDLCRIDFADTAAVHVLLDAQRDLQGHGGELIVKATAAVQRVLDLTGTSRRLHLVRC